MAMNPVAIAKRLQEEDRALTVSEQKRFPCHSNRATSLGHPCDAYIYYQRTAWDKFTLPDPESEDRMNVGKEREPFVVNRVERVAKRIGAEVRRLKQAFFDKKHQIGGDLDAVLRMLDKNKFSLKRGTQLALEVKTVSPYLWDYTESIEAMRGNRFTAGYLAQMTVYLYEETLNAGLFVFENLNGRRRYIGMRFDPKFMAVLIRKANRVNRAIKKNKPPKKLADPKICRECPAFVVCRPPLKYGIGEGVEFRDEPQLIEALEKREKLGKKLDWDSVRAFEKLDKAVKGTIRAYTQKRKKPNLIIGNWKTSVRETGGGMRVEIEALSRKSR